MFRKKILPVSSFSISSPKVTPLPSLKVAYIIKNVFEPTYFNLEDRDNTLSRSVGIHIQNYPKDHFKILAVGRHIPKMNS
jgi:hypothetical protein